MIIQPKVRGFICTTTHPLGCEANVKNQIAYAESKKIQNGPKHVLVIGASTGYGLASASMPPSAQVPPQSASSSRSRAPRRSRAPPDGITQPTSTRQRRPQAFTPRASTAMPSPMSAARRSLTSSRRISGPSTSLSTPLRLP